MKKENTTTHGISAVQLAKMLGVSHVAVHKKIKNGTIKATKIGRNYIIDHDQVAEVLGTELSDQLKQQITSSVKKIVRQYGDTLRQLGKE